MLSDSTASSATPYVASSRLNAPYGARCFLTADIRDDKARAKG